MSENRLALAELRKLANDHGRDVVRDLLYLLDHENYFNLSDAERKMAIELSKLDPTEIQKRAAEKRDQHEAANPRAKVKRLFDSYFVKHGYKAAQALLNLFNVSLFSAIQDKDLQTLTDLLNDSEEIERRVALNEQNNKVLRAEVRQLHRCATCGHRFEEGDRLQVICDEYRLLYVCADDEHKSAVRL